MSTIDFYSTNLISSLLKINSKTQFLILLFGLFSVYWRKYFININFKNNKYNLPTFSPVDLFLFKTWRNLNKHKTFSSFLRTIISKLSQLKSIIIHISNFKTFIWRSFNVHILHLNRRLFCFSQMKWKPLIITFVWENILYVI